MIIFTREEEENPRGTPNPLHPLNNVDNNFNTYVRCEAQREAFLDALGFDPFSDVYPLVGIADEIAELVARIDFTLTFMDESIEVYPILHEALTRKRGGKALYDEIEDLFIAICDYLQDVLENWKVGLEEGNCDEHNLSRADLLQELWKRYHAAFDEANRMIKQAILDVTPGASSLVKFIYALGGAIVAKFLKLLGLAEKTGIPGKLFEQVVSKAVQFVLKSLDPFKELIENAALSLSGTEDDYFAAVNAVLNDPQFASFLNEALCDSRKNESDIIYDAYFEDIVVANNAIRNRQSNWQEKVATACNRDRFNMIFQMKQDIAEINCTTPESLLELIFVYNAFCTAFGYPSLEDK